MIKLQADDKSARHWQNHADRLEALAVPPQGLIERIQEMIRLSFAENFETESAGDMPWSQLAQSTIFERVRLGYPGEHPILVRSGEYRESWINPLHEDHVSQVIYGDPGVTEIREGSKDERAAVLEEGDYIVPPRPVARLSTGAQARLRLTIQLYIEEFLGEIPND